MLQKSAIKVVIRIRPVKQDSSLLNTLPLKSPTKSMSCINQLTEKSLEIVNWRNVEETLKYEFDAVHNETATQEDVYKSSVESILKQVLVGQNASIFAYGPTGAGKTHTMLGTDSQPGIIPQVVNDMFRRITEEEKESPVWKFKAYISYLEIYQEKVFDLLELKAQDLPIRQDRHNIVIPNLSEKEITSVEQFKSVFVPASKNRMVAATNLNLRSSRSHSILLIKVKKQELSAPYRILTGKMYLIDLAGSENNKRTGNKGIRLKESGSINTSLFVLGQVVDALNRNMPRVPYRDSKLTRLLQDSLGGNSHACMITNISPEESSYMDTYTTLNLAAKSRTIINKPLTDQSYGKKSIPQTSKRKLETTEGAVQPIKKLKVKKHSETTKKTRSANFKDGAASQEQPAKFLSPFLRKQRDFHDDVTAKLLSLEEKLMKLQDKQNNPSIDDTSILQGDVFKDIQNSKNDMEWMVQQNKQFTSQLAGSSIPEKGQKRQQKHEKDNVHFIKAVKIQSVEKENVSEREFQPDPQQQAKHNLSVISLLNTGSIKELRSLQSIGEKRAKLISNWRQMYGAFKSINDLVQIPGMTMKVVETIKTNNLVTF